MKTISKFLFIVLFLIISLTVYLSIFGIETTKFNNKIINKIEKIDKNLKIELKKIKIILNPLELKLSIKTIGPKLIHENKVINLERINANILLSSFFNDKFNVSDLEISTNSLSISNLISFSRSLKQVPELFILDKIIKKGYLVADINIKFEPNSLTIDDYKINGFVKDANVKITNKFDIKNCDLIFILKKENLEVKDMKFSLNNLRFYSNNILAQIKNDKYFIIKGDINNDNINLNENEINKLPKNFVLKSNIKKIQFNSKNSFSLKLNKKFRIKDLQMESNIGIEKLLILNNFGLKNFFPKAKNEIMFSNNNIQVKYKKNNFNIVGEGAVLYQKNEDYISYSFNSLGKKLKFKTNVKIKGNPFVINFLNFKKDNKKETTISLEGTNYKNQTTEIDFFSLKDGENIIEIRDLKFDKDLKFKSLNNFEINFTDTENQKNSYKIYQKDNIYYLDGSYFNANYLIDNLFRGEKDSKVFSDKNLSININIDKVRLDNEHTVSKLIGNLSFAQKKIINGSLNGNLANNKKLKFTVNNPDGKNIITTLFIDNAEPIVRRYKFIKGFDEGRLDFYSSNDGKKSISTVKIYDFKLKELPLLTKVLTLASLQGIADILSGEGIRFDEFEMNFNNKKNLMTINEIYAIGPAISILMDGYVEKDKLVSLRGTLVPATTINKVISSIPVLGKVLVGSKTGEGVFGVSFKIKGSPKKLETSVNPIKTLTPRFITRTLEKIKKN